MGFSLWFAWFSASAALGIIELVDLTPSILETFWPDSILVLGLTTALTGLAVRDGAFDVAAELSSVFIVRLATAFASRSFRRSCTLFDDVDLLGPV